MSATGCSSVVDGIPPPILKAMLQSLWKSISSWGDLPTNFPYTLGSAIPYGFELPGGFVQFSATSTKQQTSAAAEATGRQHPILDALLNPGNASQVSVFALKRAKQQSPPFKGNGAVSQHTFDQAKNHFAKCKTLLHPNLLKVLATYETSNALYIVTECCFSLVHVVHLSRQQQQQQDLAAKRPPSLPQQQKCGPPTAPINEMSDFTRKAEAAAVAAAEVAANTCWNFLELAESISFLHDQCKLVHGEVSPFSIFVTPHGEECAIMKINEGQQSRGLEYFSDRNPQGEAPPLDHHCARSIERSTRLRSTQEA